MCVAIYESVQFRWYSLLLFTYSIERLRGTFGAVSLQWTVYQVNTSTGDRSIASNTDISPTSNFVSFPEESTSASINFAVINEELPELEELFEVELSITTVDGDSEDGARLGEFSIAMVTVSENDDPYGLFRVADDSKMVEVAEDVPEGEVEAAMVSVVVERTFGILGNVQVSDI